MFKVNCLGIHDQITNGGELTLHDLGACELPGCLVAVERHRVERLEPVVPEVEAEVGDVGEDLVEAQRQRANVRVANC